MRSKGFTLLEVMIVIVILAAAFFPLLQVMSSGLVASEEVKGSNNAVVIAQQKIEMEKNAAFANVTSETKAVISSNPAYSLQVGVTNPATNLKDVTVAVYWYTRGQEQSVSLETIITNF